MSQLKPDVRPTSMKTVLTTMLAMVIGLALVMLVPVSAHEDPPVCAVIEIDAAGRTWVNGDAADMRSTAFNQCEQPSMMIVVPDFSAPVDAFLEAVIAARDIDPATKLYMPSCRREIEVLFGMDTHLECQAFSGRTIEPVPSKASVKGQEAVKLISDPSDTGSQRSIVALDLLPSSRLGVADDVAHTSRLYDQSGGVRLVVGSRDRVLQIVVKRSDFYVPPPPKVKKRVVEGESYFSEPREYDVCAYPENAKQPL